MNKIIKININNNFYSYGNGWYPLPYGTIEGRFLFFGNLYSSRSGNWGWCLPKIAVYGYGQYCPYAEFILIGRVHIMRDKIIPSIGWRAGWETVIKLEGKIYPSFEKFFELQVKQILYEEFSKKYECKFYQGSLEINKTDIKIKEFLEKIYQKLLINESLLKIYGIEHLPEKQDVLYLAKGRKKIFNHQFFGNCKIFYTFYNSHPFFVPKYFWTIISLGKTYITSPDHIFNPIHLEEGIYLAEHPLPLSRRTID